MSGYRGPFIDDEGVVRMRCTACRGLLPLSEYLIARRTGKPMAECKGCFSSISYAVRHGGTPREVRAERQAAVRARPQPNVRRLEVPV